MALSYGAPFGYGRKVFFSTKSRRVYIKLAIYRQPEEPRANIKMTNTAVVCMNNSK